MRLTRVFVEQPLAAGGSLALPAQAARHVARVLRLAPGDALVLFDGRGGEYEAVIDTVRRDSATVRVGAHHAIERESPLTVTLLQGVARGEKMDLILQKATELGVAAVAPVLSARSSVRLDARSAARRQQHWQAIVAGACEQCGRNRLPPVMAPSPHAAALALAPPGLKLLLEPDEHSPALSTLLSSMRKLPSAVTLLIGPEGGFDPAELQQARQAGFQCCTLGPRILRTETAGLAALAALQTLAGDLR